MAKYTSQNHPELRKVAGWIPRVWLNPALLRLLRFLMQFYGGLKSTADVRIENINIPSHDGKTELSLRVYRPQGAVTPLPLLVWLHGGGYVIGNPQIDDQRCLYYAREAGVVVVSVDYRLAPEHPFPAPLEDAYTALKWVFNHAPQLGGDEQRIAIGGESAGGGLAAALAQLALERGEVRPVFQLLIYPMLDDRTCKRSDIGERENLVWNQISNRFGWGAYLGGYYGSEDLPSCAVPARRSDLAGLPPAWIGVGTLDLFHDEDVSYARRLVEKGIDCELLVVAGVFHAFDVAAPKARVVREFQESQVAALKRHLFS